MQEGMWPFNVSHGRDMMGLFWSRKENPSSPESWTHSIFSLGIYKLCFLWVLWPPGIQGHSDVMAFIKEIHKRCLCLVTPWKYTYQVSQLHQWIIYRDSKLYSRSPALKEWFAKQCFWLPSKIARVLSTVSLQGKNGSWQIIWQNHLNPNVTFLKIWLGVTLSYGNLTLLYSLGIINDGTILFLEARLEFFQCLVLQSSVGFS